MDEDAKKDIARVEATLGAQIDALGEVVRSAATLILTPNVEWATKARRLQHALDTLNDILPRQSQLMVDLQTMIDDLDE